MQAIQETARRLWLLGLIVTATLSASRADAGEWPWKGGTPPRGGKIGYIRPEIPALTVPPVDGVRYADRVPDTPDMAEMSKLAINVLTCADDRQQDYEQYFSVYIGNPLRMAHNFSDWCTPKFTEALALLRVVTGSNDMTQVDQVWQDSIRKSIGPDGLFYFPIVGKPWYGKELFWAKGIARADGSLFTVEKPDPKRLADLDTFAQSHANSVIEESGITQFTHPQPLGRIVQVLDIYHQRDGNPLWAEMIRKIVDRVDELAIRKDDYDFYEDADRWSRNYFAELQLTRSKADHLVQHGRTMEPKTLLSKETDEEVAQRNLGAFGSWSGPNEWWAGYRQTDNLIMHCCTGNCARALFFLWRHILDYQQGELKVNMLLNRASPWADVYSYIPYEGRVDIKMKQRCSSLLVHAPEWIPTGDTRIAATVDGKPRACTWQGRYLALGATQPAEKIVIAFPISERQVTEKMGRSDYTLTLRGNTVVWIDPPGQICPLFQRDYYREGVRWREVQRFVAKKSIDY